MAQFEPPKWADRFVEKICPEQYLEEVQGDLHEAFYWRLGTRGHRYARRKFFFEAILTIRLAKFKTPGFMKNLSFQLLKNYSKTAYRHLRRHKQYLLINVIGLGLAMTLCTVAYINWKFDADFDQFHAHAEKIFRVTTIKSNSLEMYGVCPAPVAEIARSTQAGVIDAISLDSWNVIVNKEKETHTEVLHFSEPSFLKWFSFNLLHGTAEIDNPNTVLITERMAKKYFANENPIGQSLTFFADDPRKKELIISGILENPPLNSSIQFNFITHLSNQVNRSLESIRSTDWKEWKDAVFLVLKNPDTPSSILSGLNKYIPAHQSAQPNFGSKSFALEPFKGMAARSNISRWEELQDNLPSSAIWINIIMAILLLLTACLNFANTTISLSGKRLKEIGVRKVLGGSQSQLIHQLLVESFMVCVLALLISIPLSDYVLKIYNQLYTVLDLKLSFFENPLLVFFLLGIVLFTSLLAGAYPSLYISSFNPKHILHGSVKFGGNTLVSRILLGLQVSISLIALIAGFTFARNATYLEESNFGFERKGVQAVVTQDESTFNIYKDEVLKEPLIQQAAGVHSHIGDSCPRVECSINGQKGEVEYMIVGDEYLDLMEIQTIQGRGFNALKQTDYETALLVNEKFVADFLPNKNPLGQKVVFSDTINCSIIGVVNNFMQDGFHDPLRPLVLRLGKPNQFEYLAVKTDLENNQEVQAILKSIWTTNFPMKPFEHYFQDDFLAKSIQQTNNVKWFMTIIAIITLLLTITGLFALISLKILKQSKEIAIRRVLGASVTSISFLLNKNYIWVISTGIVLGCTLGAWFSFQMLNNIYNIHAGISNSLLILAAIMTLVILLLTIAIKIVGLMKTNPVEVLKG